MTRCLWVLVAATLVLASGASAATITVTSSGRLSYEAAPGEANDVRLVSVSVGDDELDVVVDDAGAPLDPVTLCETRAEGGVICHPTLGSSLWFALGDGADRFTGAGACRGLDQCVPVVFGGAGSDIIVGTDTGDTLFGGSGGDILEGGPGERPDFPSPGDHLYGGRGNDDLRGGAGTDLLDGGAGDDRHLGGQGWDEISYAGRRTPVFVGLNGQPDDGGRGEADTIESDVEIVAGSQASDTLMGNGRRNILRGLGGNDVLFGEGGPDWLLGGRGSDRIFGGSGRDDLWAYETDGLRHPGREPGFGRDRLFGEAGADSFITSDGNGDQLDGGAGRDGAFIDPTLDRLTSLENARGYLTGRARAARE